MFRRSFNPAKQPKTALAMFWIIWLLGIVFFPYPHIVLEGFRQYGKWDWIVARLFIYGWLVFFPVIGTVRVWPVIRPKK